MFKLKYRLLFLTGPFAGKRLKSTLTFADRVSAARYLRAVRSRIHAGDTRNWKPITA